MMKKITGILVTMCAVIFSAIIIASQWQPVAITYYEIKEENVSKGGLALHDIWERSQCVAGAEKQGMYCNTPYSHDEKDGEKLWEHNMCHIMEVHCSMAFPHDEGKRKICEARTDKYRCINGVKDLRKKHLRPREIVPLVIMPSNARIRRNEGSLKDGDGNIFSIPKRWHDPPQDTMAFTKPKAAEIVKTNKTKEPPIAKLTEAKRAGKTVSLTDKLVAANKRIGELEGEKDRLENALAAEREITAACRRNYFCSFWL